MTLTSFRDLSLARKLIVAAALLMLVVLAARFVWLARVERQLESMSDELAQRHGSLYPSSLAPPRVPPDENRAAMVRAAMEATTMPAGAEGRRLNELLRYSAPITGEADVALLRGVGDANEVLLPLLRAAAERPRSNWEILYGKGTAANIPDLTALMRTSRAVAAQAIVRVRDGKPAEAVEWIVGGLAAAQSLDQEPVLIVQMVRVGVHRLMLGAVREVLASGEADSATLDRLATAVSDTWSPGGIHDGFLGEMKAFHADFDRLGLGDGPPPGPDGSSWTSNRFNRWFARPWIRAQHVAYLELMDRVLEFNRLPRFERFRKFPTHPFDAPREWWQLDQVVAVPNLKMVTTRGDLDETRFALARAAIALELRRAAEGGYPDALDALVPDYLPEVPTDPFTGRALDYRPGGSGFVLRSAGADEGPETLGIRHDPLLVWDVRRDAS